MHLLNFVSDAGDSAVLLPVAALSIFFLWRYQSLRAAETLVVALAACAAVITVLKLLLIACGDAWGAGIVSPSGHASMSAAVYGALGIIAAGQAPRWQRPLVVMASWILVLCIALSRVAVGAHSWAEVGVGLLVGAATLTLFAVRYFRVPRSRVNLVPLMLVSLTIVVLLHGVHLPIERLIQKFAFFGRAATGICPGG